MLANLDVEKISRKHQRKNFECGEPALNDYLANFALQNSDSRLSPAYVAVESGSTRVLGYYALTIKVISKQDFPEASVKRFPKFPLPTMCLARLAVLNEVKGNGIGEFLLMNALERCLKSMEEVGGIAILVDAKHEKAKSFYLRYEFESLPDKPLTLWLPVAALKRMFS